MPDELIEPGLEKFLAALFPDLTYQLRLYDELRGYGWTAEELLIALQTGYNYGAHAADQYHSKGWKSYYNAKGMHDWHRHHYRETHANRAGLSFEEFVNIWRQFYDASTLEGCTPLQYMQLYVKARRIGMPHDESYNLLRWHGAWAKHFKLYVELRRWFHRSTVEELVEARAYPRALDYTPGYYMSLLIMKALRRGATMQQVLEYLRSGKIHKLDKVLREAAAAKASPES